MEPKDIQEVEEQFTQNFLSLSKGKITDLMHNVLDITKNASIRTIDLAILSFINIIKSLIVSFIQQFILAVNEKELINYTKELYRDKGIILEVNQKVEKQIILLCGPMKFKRTILRPKTNEDSILLKKLENKTLIIPLDDYLQISNLPFKMTVDVMIEIAYWAQNQFSYERTESAIEKILQIKINDDTIRKVTNHIGRIVFNNDKYEFDMLFEKYQKADIIFPNKKTNKILYIETDGAALNTRTKSIDGSSWRECKQGMVFSSDNIHYWKDKKGVQQHKILKKDCISYIGGVEEFQKYLFWLAFRNGYGTYSKTVLLSDGATWIRNMKNYLFPDAQQILDFFHLKEKVYDYAKIYFNLDKEKYDKWSENICEKLKKSQWQSVLKIIEKLDKEKPNTVPLYSYIHNNQENIDYKSYKKLNYFIGSGAIESNNKILVQRRLKQAGMRWNIDTAQNLLTLVSKSESMLWETDVVNVVNKYYNSLK